MAFDPEFIKTMGGLIKEEITGIESELARFAHRNPNSTDGDYQTDFEDIGSSEDENAAEVARFSDNLTLENTLEKALRDAKAALKRIDEKKYGICKYCKEPITEPRLKARPTSSACIKCKKTLTQEM